MTKLHMLRANAACAIRRFGTDQSGATSIEYALIAAGISIVIVAAVTAVGSSVKSRFEAASNF